MKKWFFLPFFFTKYLFFRLSFLNCLISLVFVFSYSRFLRDQRTSIETEFCKQCTFVWLNASSNFLSNCCGNFLSTRARYTCCRMEINKICKYLARIFLGNRIFMVGIVSSISTSASLYSVWFVNSDVCSVDFSSFLCRSLWLCRYSVNSQVIKSGNNYFLKMVVAVFLWGMVEKGSIDDPVNHFKRQYDQFACT